ncbi:MAG: hypothetical protein ACE37B_17845 [Ilumatobacter sp.]|uniref:hypothetical protein n=1 Tax=Ilumatobacter sp. TaxID=1967498 RepID=UPI003918B3A5
MIDPIDLLSPADYDVNMSDTAKHDGAGEDLIVVPLDEALRLAKPWAPDPTTGIEDVTDEEWDAFITALEQR